jgi:lipoyl-dependent peroxiredoxin
LCSPHASPDVTTHLTHWQATDKLRSVGKDGQQEPTLSAARAEELVHIARRLRELRHDRGLRLADLAALTGTSEAHLYRLEQGERWPSLPALLTLAHVYGIAPATLLGPTVTPRLMARHRGRAQWEGEERTGSGVMLNHSVRLRYDGSSRLSSLDGRVAYDGSDEVGSSPEELIGMALAGCFSMSLAQQLGAAGFSPDRIETAGEVRLGLSGDDIGIKEIHLMCDAVVAGISTARFEEIAQITKRSCVVARALVAVPVTLEAQLVTESEVLTREGV